MGSLGRNSNKLRSFLALHTQDLIYDNGQQKPGSGKAEYFMGSAEARPLLCNVAVQVHTGAVHAFLVLLSESITASLSARPVTELAGSGGPAKTSSRCNQP
jgi:hypothetical protein